MSEIIKINDIEHLLLRPAITIGSTVLNKSYEFIFSENKMIYKEIEYVPAFMKIFGEILDNSIDENIRTKGKYSNKIEINIDDKKMMITVKDNGRGLSSVIDSEYKIPRAVLAVTESRAGINFSDNKCTKGQNGIGSFGTCVFSKFFELDTSDGIYRTRLICKNNLSTKEYTQTKSNKHYTTISFIPDFQRLSMSFIDDIHFNMIHKIIIDASLAFPNIKFYFNDKLIKNKTFNDYVKLYSDEFESFTSEKCDIGIIHNQELDNVSFVNGIYTKDGGTHVDHITNGICYRLRDILIKKYKTIKPIDIRNNCFFIINIKNMIAPRFDSQIKTHLINVSKDLTDVLEKIDFELITKKLLKCDNIIFPITETFKIKEDLRRRLELKNQEKKIKKIEVIPKLLEANSKNRKECTLYLCEGDCLHPDIKIKVLENGNFIDKKIKDIKVNDKVLTHKNKIRPVINKFYNNKQKVKIYFNNHYVICSPNHRWYIFDSLSKKYYFIKTKNIDIKKHYLVSY